MKFARLTQSRIRAIDHDMDVHYYVKHRLNMSWTLVANNARSLQGNFARSAANQRARIIVAM